MPRPIGLTMRCDPRDAADRVISDGSDARAAGAGRDARAGSVGADRLPAEWPVFLRRVFPGARALPIPNIGREAVAFLRPWRLGGVILTGGNDVGTCAERDETERAVLEACIRDRLPVLGVCRGLQVLQDFFGGPLARVPDAHDRGRVHAIDVADDRTRRWLGCSRFRAPSFHRFGVAAEQLAAELAPCAFSEDGVVEAARHRVLPIVAVQWHPERPMPDSEPARGLLRAFADGFAS